MDSINEHKLQSEFKRVFTPDIQNTLIKLLSDAYDMRDEACNQCHLLKDTNIGQELKAHVLRAAIERVAFLYCSKGLLPWNFSIKKNRAGNCNHIELCYDDSIIYFARVRNPEKKPKRVKYRPDLHVNLFTKIIPSIDTFLVTYGDVNNGERKFGAIGIPGDESWLYFKLLDMDTAGDLKGEVAITPEERKEMLVGLIDETTKTSDRIDKNAK